MALPVSSLEMHFIQADNSIPVLGPLYSRAGGALTSVVEKTIFCSIELFKGIKETALFIIVGSVVLAPNAVHLVIKGTYWKNNPYSLSNGLRVTCVACYQLSLKIPQRALIHLIEPSLLIAVYENQSTKSNSFSIPPTPTPPTPPPLPKLKPVTPTVIRAGKKQLPLNKPVKKLDEALAGQILALNQKQKGAAQNQKEALESLLEKCEDYENRMTMDEKTISKNLKPKLAKWVEAENPEFFIYMWDVLSTSEYSIENIQAFLRKQIEQLTQQENRPVTYNKGEFTTVYTPNTETTYNDNGELEQKKFMNTGANRSVKSLNQQLNNKFNKPNFPQQPIQQVVGSNFNVMNSQRQQKPGVQNRPPRPLPQTGEQKTGVQNRPPRPVLPPRGNLKFVQRRGKPLEQPKISDET